MEIAEHIQISKNNTILPKTVFHCKNVQDGNTMMENKNKTGIKCKTQSKDDQS